MSPVTVEQLAEWKSLAESARPGPWQLEGNWTVGQPMGGWLSTMHPSPIFGLEPITGEAAEIKATADFIVAARTAVPVLVAEVKRLTNELRSVKQALQAEQRRHAKARQDMHAASREAERLRDFARSAVVAFDLAAELMPDNVVNFAQFAIDARAALPEEPAGGE